MFSPIVIVTAIESAFGVLLNSANIFLVLWRGRKPYHYIFAVLLFTYLIWDLAIFLTMVRNNHINEILIYASMITPAALIQTLIFHFTVVYLNKTKQLRWSLVLVWAFTLICLILMAFGYVFNISGVYQYEWGNIFKVENSPLDPVSFIGWFGLILPACWMLYRNTKIETTELKRRHSRYIMIGFLVTAFAIVKVLVVMGIDVLLSTALRNVPGRCLCCHNQHCHCKGQAF